MALNKAVTPGGKKMVCLLVAPVADGRNAWYFIEVPEPKLKKFQKDAAAGGVDLTQYGEVLDRGFGDYPPQEVIDYMMQEYGFQL
jgi:hypothetical protein